MILLLITPKLWGHWKV